MSIFDAILFALLIILIIILIYLFYKFVTLYDINDYGFDGRIETTREINITRANDRNTIDLRDLRNIRDWLFPDIRIQHNIDVDVFDEIPFLFGEQRRDDEGDPQNVHDNNVNRKYKNKILHLIKLNGEWMGANVASIYQQTYLELTNAGKSDKNLIKVLNKIMEGCTIDIGVKSYPERQILAETWHRIHHDDNGKNRDLLEESIVNSLKDGVDNNGMIQCSIGRVHRIVDSLVNLDADKILSEPVPTTAILKIEVNSKIAKLLNDELEASSELSDDYNSGKNTKSVSEMKSRIEEKLKEYLDDYDLDDDTTKKFMSYIDEAF